MFASVLLHIYPYISNVAARAGVEPTTLRLKVIDSTKAPPRPTTYHIYATRQKRAFSIVGPSVWNGLPSDLRSLPRDLSRSFYKLLKTLLVWLSLGWERL